MRDPRKNGVWGKRESLPAISRISSNNNSFRHVIMKMCSLEDRNFDEALFMNFNSKVLIRPKSMT